MNQLSFARFQRFGRDISGVLLIALALMTLVGLILPRWTGWVLTWWVNQLRLWLGWGSLWFVVGFGVAGYYQIRRTHEYQPIPWLRIIVLELAALISLALLAVISGESLARAEAGLDGGRLGWGLAYLTGGLFRPLGAAGDVLHAMLLGLVVLLLVLGGIGALQKMWINLKQEPVSIDSSPPTVSMAPIQSITSSEPSAKIAKQRFQPLPAEFRKRLKAEETGEPEKKARLEREREGLTPADRDEHLPGLDLLVNETTQRPDERNINLTAGLIEKTLAEFGIPAKVVSYRIGPTVTQFAVEPGFLEKPASSGSERPASSGSERPISSENERDVARQKVRVAQISALSRDLALALSAERLRIEAPVPGRPYLGIEVPNSRSAIVRLRPILETDAYYKLGSPLTLALGRDVSGAPVVADLARMPHLLIAGTTGSGKSVCISAITTCLVMNNTPDDLRLVMIDPKMVELIRFNGLPHLFGKVETKLERILGVLRWTVAEMDRRYKVLESTRSRNLDSYNRKARRHRELLPLPHIVLIIDELADLMMSAPDQTEPALIRLAQLARATGIHLVVATQRPSTDVVTGLIKANFPARMAFAVASSVDSRVILDTVGAESLLGHGDMLFLPPEAGSPVRCQGVIVTDTEVERVINFWQHAHPRSGEEAPPWEGMLQERAALEDRDALIEQAIQFVRQSRRASASLLQRRLRIGYPRAARLIDELEELGVIGPAVQGGREREVLISRDEDDVED